MSPPSRREGRLLHLDGQVHHDTYALPMGNYGLCREFCGGARRVKDDALAEQGEAGATFIWRLTILLVTWNRAACRYVSGWLRPVAYLQAQ
jgi:hypothetical protein